MRNKFLRLIVPLLCAGGLAAAPATASAVTVGISDQGASMFTSSYFTSLHVKQARLGVEWNAAVEKNRSALNAAAAWIKAAQAAGVSPLVVFGADPGAAGNHVPSIREYTSAVKAFIRKFPTVKQYVPWNEPDFNYRSLSRNPALAAEYFNVLTQNCRGCTIVAGEVYLDAGHLAAWINRYKKGLRYRPKAWGLHPYNDVQGHSTSQIRTMLRLIGRAQLWLTEVSGVITRGHWHGGILHQSPAKQALDEKFLFSLPARFHQVTRIYHYEWQGAPGAGWDSGLLDYGGKPRPAYYVLAKAAGH